MREEEGEKIKGADYTEGEKHEGEFFFIKKGSGKIKDYGGK